MVMAPRITQKMEPATGIEPTTSPLPRVCSTPELRWLSKNWSGRRDSNPRPSAWKADALPTELLPQNGPQMYAFNDIFQHMKNKCCYMVMACVGRAGFEPTKA